MLDRTHAKLREVRFFLDHLTRESQRPFFRDPEVFEFYLSALLNSMRSVVWLVEREGKRLGRSKYSMWENSWNAARSDDRRALQAFLENERDEEVHGPGVDLSVVWDYVPINQVESEHSFGGKSYFFGPPGAEEPSVGVPRHLFKKRSEEEQRNVVPLCQQHLAYLEAMVADFVTTRHRG